jgi:hypothetical protein
LLLGDSRVNPAAQDNYAIGWAAMNGHKEVFFFFFHQILLKPLRLSRADSV